MSNVSDRRIRSCPPATAAPAQPPAQLWVLIADAEPLVRWALAKALEASGHRVVAAADGDAVLHALGDRNFDAAVVDWQLADGRHSRLLDSIHAVAPELPVVGMTALPGQDLTRLAREHGASRILEKPFDVFSLDRVLLEVCTAARRPSCVSHPSRHRHKAGD